MPEKIALITGSNRGIGAQTAKNLVALDYRVILACRNITAAQTLKNQLHSTHSSTHSNPKIEIIHCDLSEFSSLYALRDWFMQHFTHLDVLINNAGVALTQRTTNSQGYEATFTINHLGHFLLTGLLLPALTQAKNGRIINISSNAHQAARLNLNDLMSEQHYSMYPVYCRSKLANILFTYELVRRLQHTDITSHCVHPGMIDSDIWSFDTWRYRFAYYLFRPLMRTLEQGAYCSTFLATTDQAAALNGLYLNPKAKPMASSRSSHDPALARTLWQRSEQLTDFYWPPSPGVEAP